MNEINETGGAYIGNGRATAPFARLTVNKYMLQLNAGLIGNLVFRTSDIISITPYSGTLGTKGGISINHRVGKYKKNVAFLTSGTAQLIEQIKQTGFPTNTDPLPTETEQCIAKMQASGVYPVKTSAIIAIVVIWNIFLIPTFYSSIVKGVTNFQSIGIRLSIGFMFLLCLSLLILPPIQRLVLKDGRTIDGLKITLCFVMLMMAIMFTAFSFLPPIPK